MIIEKKLLEKYISGLATDDEAAQCEQYLQNNDHAADLGQFELDTDFGQDTILKSLRNRIAGPPISASDYDQITEMINNQVQENLDTVDIASFLNPAQSDDEIGRLGPYRIIEKIGSGGMGIVFRAEHLETGETVALKVMNPLMASNPQTAERFRREVRAAAKLEHPRIIPILDIGSDAGIPYFTMQLLAGESLSTLLKRDGKLAPNRVREIVLQIVEGLEYAEQLGIQHRDIKPDNLWIDQQGQVVILDFGLARGADDTTGLTKTGDVLGTPQYMAPEQVTGQSIDHRTDLFSLGAVMYEMLTGTSKFADQNVFSTMMAVTHRDVSMDELIAKDCPRPMAELVRQLLEKSPENRPASAAAVREQLTTINLDNNQHKSESDNGRNGMNRMWLGFAGGFFAATAMFLVAILIHVKTDRGTLVIEADEGVEVTTLKDGAIIRLIDTKKTYRVKLGENKLPSGAYEIIVSDPQSKITFSSDRFAIRRGDRKIVNLTFKKPSPERTTVMTEKTRKQMQTVKHACISFRNAAGRWPRTIDELMKRPNDLVGKKWRGPYLGGGMLEDYWHSKLSLKTSDKKLIVWSAGPDKKFATADDIYGDSQSNVTTSDSNAALQPVNLNHLSALPIRETLGLKNDQVISKLSLAARKSTLIPETRYHRKRIRDMSLDRHEKLLAVGGDDAVVRIWSWQTTPTNSPRKQIEKTKDSNSTHGATPKRQSETRKLFHILPCRYPVQRVSWSPTSNLLAVVASDPYAEIGHLLIWRVSETKTELLYRIEQVCQEISFSPNGGLLALQSKTGIRVLDLDHRPQPKLLPNFGLNGQITKRAWSPDSKFLAVTRRNSNQSDSASTSLNSFESAQQNNVVIWDVNARKVHHRFPRCAKAGYLSDIDSTPLLAMLKADNSDGLVLQIANCQTFTSALVRTSVGKTTAIWFSSCFNGYGLVRTQPQRYWSSKSTIDIGYPMSSKAENRWAEAQFRVDLPRGVQPDEHVVFTFGGKNRFSIADEKTFTNREMLPREQFRAMALAFTDGLPTDHYVEIQYNRSAPKTTATKSEARQQKMRTDARLINVKEKTVHRFLDFMMESDYNKMLQPQHIAVSPSNKYIAVARMRPTTENEHAAVIEIFDHNSHKIIRTIQLEQRLRAPVLRWSPNGKYLIAHDDHRRRVEAFKPADKDFVVQLLPRPSKTRAGFAPRAEQQYFFHGKESGRVVLQHKLNGVGVFELETGKMVCECVVEIEPDRSFRSERRPRNTTFVGGFDWNSESKRLAIFYCDQHKRKLRIRIVQMSDDQFDEGITTSVPILATANGWLDKLKFIAISPNNNGLIVGYSTQYRKKMIGQPETEMEIYKVSFDKTSTQKIAADLDPDQQFLSQNNKIAGYKRGKLTMIDIETGKITKRFVGQDIDFQNTQLRRTTDGWAIIAPRQLRFFDRDFKLLKTILKTDWSTDAGVAIVRPDGIIHGKSLTTRIEISGKTVRLTNVAIE